MELSNWWRTQNTEWEKGPRVAATKQARGNHGGSIFKKIELNVWEEESYNRQGQSKEAVSETVAGTGNKQIRSFEGWRTFQLGLTHILSGFV